MEPIKKIKHLFMAYRNGIVADTLRKAGINYSIIFGLQLPQLSMIAREFEPDMNLAMQLWNDKNIRESRLLACYLFPAEELTEQQCIDLAESLQTKEEADILCFRLLRRLPFADKLADRLIMESASPLFAYCGEALIRNLEAIKQ
ncbi:MAG: hypothetical protein HDR88_03205 [Bacteroides sp.]|nr:hypothetical protein [Bacteroides sp.]